MHLVMVHAFGQKLFVKAVASHFLQVGLLLEMALHFVGVFVCHFFGTDAANIVGFGANEDPSTASTLASAWI